MQKSRNNERNKTEFDVVRGSDNVFKDLGFEDEEAANLLIRADLMIAIVQIIDERGWKPQEAAQALGVAQTRISELRKGKMKEFSVDLLLKYLARLGKNVDLSVRKEMKQQKPAERYQQGYQTKPEDLEQIKIMEKAQSAYLADAELDAITVNLIWQREPLSLIEEVAAAMGIPYQAYIKQVLYRQALDDLSKIQGTRAAQGSAPAAPPAAAPKQKTT